MTLQSLTDFFMWTTVLNVGLLVFYTVFLVFLPDFTYRMHHKLFDISRDQYKGVIFGLVGLYKLMFITFSLVPYLALRLLA